MKCRGGLHSYETIVISLGFRLLFSYGDVVITLVISLGFWLLFSYGDACLGMDGDLATIVLCGERLSEHAVPCARVCSPAGQIGGEAVESCVCRRGGLCVAT